MTRQEIDRVTQFIELTFRARTPATRVDEQLPEYRVGRGEIRRFCLDNGIAFDEWDEQMNRAWARVMRRLKRDFPSELWPGTKPARRRCDNCGKAKPDVAPRGDLVVVHLCNDCECRNYDQIRTDPKETR